MKNLFVSVIIPTLNEEKYIENTLKSLRNQDYKGRYEIIVSDGCSKDKTVKIAKKYADKVIINKKRGISVGRNEGAKVARGEIFLFIDADTIAYPNLLTEIVKGFKKDVVGVSCPVLALSPNMTNFIFYWIYNQFLKTSVKLKMPKVAGICCAYRRDAFEKIGGFDENIKTLEDFDISKRISKLGKIVVLDSTFVLTSPRRIEKWGKKKTIIRYLKLFFYHLIGENLKTDEYRPIR